MTQKDSRQERLNIQADALRRRQDALLAISKGGHVESAFDKIALIDENSRLRLELLEAQERERIGNENTLVRIDLPMSIVVIILAHLVLSALF